MDEHDNLHDPNRLVRGRPTSRGSLKPETSMAIPMIMGNVPAKLGDPQIIPDCFMTEVLYAVQWIHDLNYIKLKTLENMVDKHSAKGGGSDTAIRSYVELFPTMEKLNSSQARLMMAKTYLTSEMKIAFMEFTTDDEGNKKPIKFRDEVKKVIIIIITMTMVSFFIILIIRRRRSSRRPPLQMTSPRWPSTVGGGLRQPTQTHTSAHSQKEMELGFPKSHWEEGSQSHPLWGVSPSHFGVFPKATSGCFPKPLWGVSPSCLGVILSSERTKRLISQSHLGAFSKATLGCFPKPLWGASQSHLE